MDKPLNEFGGWLRVFQVVLWFNFVVAGVSTLGFIFLLLKGKTSFALWILIPHEFVFTFLYFLLILRLAKKSPETPNYISKVIIAMLALAVISLILYVVLNHQILQALKIFGPKIGWAIIWFTYFKSSKRVKMFYI